jgi:hypothetical protein
MKTQWIAAIALGILTSAASATPSEDEIFQQAVKAKAVTEKLEACMQREPLERDFLRHCMLIATTFAEIQSYPARTSKPENP